MVWFNCEGCGDTVKKPKLASHMSSCWSQAFSCIDCCVTFDRQSVHGHNACVTEHEKYALGVTKPGGAAAKAQAVRARALRPRPACRERPRGSGGSSR